MISQTKDIRDCICSLTFTIIIFFKVNDMSFSYTRNSRLTEHLPYNFSLVRPRIAATRAYNNNISNIQKNFPLSV